MNSVKLACNYLLEAEELLKEEKVMFDYFKFPGIGLGDEDLQSVLMRIDRIKKIKPILYHGVFPNRLNLCHEDFSAQFDLEACRNVCKQTRTPGISLHLEGADGTVSKTKLIKTTLENVLFLKQHFPDMQFIALENCERNENAFIFDPAFITKIIKEADLFFLLDISHANWSAETRGETLLKYIDQLPMSRVYEIHINGWVKTNGRQTAHVRIQEDLYDLVKGLVSNFPVRILTLEYGRPSDPYGTGCPLVSLKNVNPVAKVEVEEQLNRLAEIIA